MPFAASSLLRVHATSTRCSLLVLPPALAEQATFKTIAVVLPDGNTTLSAFTRLPHPRSCSSSVPSCPSRTTRLGPFGCVPSHSSAYVWPSSTSNSESSDCGAGKAGRVEDDGKTASV